MTWNILQGDCVEAMQALEPASVDAVVCDPPYGLEFMGKDWDKFSPSEPTRRSGWDHSATSSRLDTEDEAKPYGRVAFGKRRRTFECEGCGKRDGFRNPHPCGERWKAVWVDEYPLEALSFQEWSRRWAVEAFRVLKPGGHLLAFGGTRTYHRLACALEDAGFEIRDCLAWLYGSGFPKSLDVSKAIDKDAGHWRGQAGEVVSGNGSMSGPNYERAAKGEPITEDAQRWEGWGTALKPAHEPIVLARKPLVGTVARNVLTFGTGSMNIDGCRIKNGQGDGGSVGEADPRGCPVHGLHGVREDDAEVALEHREGEVAGDVQPPVSGEVDDGPRQSSLQGELGGSPDGLPDGQTGSAGSGDTRPDPGWASGGSRTQGDHGGAPGSLAGAEGARTPRERGQAGQQAGEPDADGLVGALAGTPNGSSAASGTGGREPGPSRCTCGASGRWPSNVILDEQAAAMLDEQTGELTSGVRAAGTYTSGGQNCYGAYDSNERAALPGSSGGASRFFATFGGCRFQYTPKASRAERNAGLEGFEEREARGYQPLTQECAECGNRTVGPDGLTCGHGVQAFVEPNGGKARNHHPTVKPVSLMRWLVRLVTPPGGLVLDPFAGSGTTGVAAVLEGFRFLGIEREEEYVSLARARVGWWQEHGEDALRIVAERERAEAEREQIAASGQLGLLDGVA